MALFVADLAVVGACEILAVRIVHQTPAGSGSALIPDLILGGLLQLAAAVAFWANGLSPRWPRQLMVNTFSELRDIIYTLAFASCFVLGINHLFGGLEARSSVAPVTIVVALTIAALAVPMGRALARALMPRPMLSTSASS